MSFTRSVPTLAPDEHYDPPLGPRVWAGAILMLSSLGFFFLAGCFAIGILLLLDPPGLAGPPTPGVTAAASSPPTSTEAVTFVVTLYVLTGLSVLAAGVLFFMGLTGLVRILYGKTGTA